MLPGSGEVLKSSNGEKNLTAEQSSVTRSCSRKNSTYPRKSPKSPKKSAYRASGGTQGTAVVEVVPPNALHREIKPVLDPWMEPARSIDCHLAADAVSGEQHHAANRVADSHESGQLFRNLLDDVRNASLFPECGNHRIARQPELAQLRTVMQVNAGRRVHELEHHTARQRFAPKKLVVPAERGTQGVRILFRVTRRVRPKIEGNVNSTMCVHAPTFRSTVKMDSFRFIAVSG